jgi:hypothetical protein
MSGAACLPSDTWQARKKKSPPLSPVHNGAVAIGSVSVNHTVGVFLVSSPLRAEHIEKARKLAMMEGAFCKPKLSLVCSHRRSLPFSMFLIGFLSLAVPSVAVRKTRLTWVNGIAHTLEHMEDAKDKVKINLYPSDGQEDSLPAKC